MFFGFWGRFGVGKGRILAEFRPGETSERGKSMKKMVLGFNLGVDGPIYLVNLAHI